MFKRLKEILASPYAAPLTQPAKAVGKFAFRPIDNFIGCVKDAVNDTNSGDPLYVRLLKSITDNGSSYAYDSTKFYAWSGMVVGGLAASLGAGFAAFGSFGWWGAAIAGVAATSAGVVAGPFIVAGLVAVGAAIGAAAVMGVPSAAEGVIMAFKHRKAAKTAANAVQAVPQLAAAAIDQRAAAGEMLYKIRAMPAEAQGPLLKSLNDQYRGSSVINDSDDIMRTLATMSEKDKQAFVKTMQTTLKDSFDAVAQQESDAAMQLYKPVKTAGPLKLKSTQSP